MTRRSSAVEELDRRIEIAREAIVVADSMAEGDAAGARKLRVQLQAEIAEFEAMIDELDGRSPT